MKYEAYGDRIIARRVESEGQRMSPGGILLPESAQKHSQEAVIVSVGEGKPLAFVNRVGDGPEFDRPRLSVGETVLVNEYAGFEFVDGGEKYVVLNTSEVLAVLRASR